MPRYLIELPNHPSILGCQRAFQALAAQGSHFIAHTDWGCKVGVHKGWLIVEAEVDADVQRIVPPVLRKNASVVRLSRFAPDQFPVEHETPPRSILEWTHGSAEPDSGSALRVRFSTEYRPAPNVTA